MGVAGVGFVTFGGLSKHNKKLHPQIHETPLEILKMRLAKGEITKKEFDNIKQDIQ